MTKLPLVMFATKDFAVPTFVALAEAGANLRLLVTQPDRPKGRKQEIIPAQIRLEAERRGIPAYQPENVNAAEAIQRIGQCQASLLVTAAYGQRLSAELLGLVPHGGINLHGSILPAYRGASPVARAIQDGCTSSGVTIIQMTPQIDAGGMIAKLETPIDPDETAGQLESRLAQLGAPLVLETIERIAAAQIRIIEQDPTLASKAPKLGKDDRPIVWTRSARQIHDHVRAMQPWPIASTSWDAQDGRDPTRILIHRTNVAQDEGLPGTVLISDRHTLRIAAGQGSVDLLVLQVPGKKPLETAEFLRGRQIAVGDRLG